MTAQMKREINRTVIDRKFAMLVVDKIKKEGLETVGHQWHPGILVSVGHSQYIGVVCSPKTDRTSDKRILVNVHQLVSAKPRPNRVVVVMPELRSEEFRLRLQKSYGVDVIELPKFGAYLREWRELFTETDDQPRRRPQPKQRRQATPAMRLKANADIIITIARSIALQIDGKLGSLRQQKPNSPDAIATLHDEIAEYEELRTKVANLEAEVVKLKQRKTKATAVMKAGTTFDANFGKWWSKSGPKVLDKSADMGIVLASAGLLALIGVSPGLAAGIAATVVTGKSLASLYKGTLRA